MNAEQARRLAKHYLACAHQMTDPKDKAAFLDLVAYWMRMAEQAEQNEP